MKKFKKTLSVVLIMAMTCVPCQAFAAVEEQPDLLMENGTVGEDDKNPLAGSDFNVDDLPDSLPINYGNWIATKNDDGTLTVVGCRALSEYMNVPLTIPDTIEGMTVTGIAGYSLETDVVGYFDVFAPELVEEIIFPDTVTHMEGSGIFGVFKNLKAITLPNNPDFDTAEVCLECFYGCESLETITTRNGLTLDFEHEGEFETVKTINFHEGVECVYGSGGENLTTINLPSTVKVFGWDDAPKLRELNCPKDLKDISITNLTGCESLHIAVHVFPTEYTEIFYGDFSYSGITELNIDGACLAEGYSWNEDAFLRCPYLTAINVGEGAQYIYSKDGVLYWQPPGRDPDLLLYPAGKSTESNYTVPSNILQIYPWTFDGCKFTSITIPEDINPGFEWFVYVGEDNQSGYSVFSNINAKLRVIKGSPAFDYSETKAGMAKYLWMDENRIELYKGKNYSISYELNGGSNAPSNPTSYQAGDDKITLGNPTKKGYRFLGWMRDDISEVYTDTTERKDYFKNYKFTAEWEKEGGGEIISVTDITLNESELALETGETAKLTAAVLPKNATDKSVIWKSSDEKIASVDQDGTVTAIAPGTAVIEAAARDGSNIKASCTVIVGSEKKEQEISGQNRYEKTFGDEDFSLDAELTAGDGKLTYQSGNEAVAVISEQGKVTIKGAGTTQLRVTASATAQYKKTEKVITLTVKKAVPDLQCSISKEEIKVGQAAKLSISASVEGVLFSSDDESIASVSEDGKVSGISPGTTYLTVTVPESDNYKKAETKVRITVTAQEEAVIDMSECSITLSGKSFVYNGQAKEPEVSVFYNGEQLPQNEYVVFYRNNINPGTAVVSVFAGGGRYTGYKEAEFTIKPQASEGQTEIADGEYKESDLTEIEIKAGVTSIGSEAFAYCMDLTEIHFFGNVPEIAEDAFTEVTAKAYYPASDNTWTLDKLKGYGGSIEWVPWDISTGEVVKRNIAARKIEISAGEYVYTGEAFEPEVIVMDGDLQLTAGTDYTVTYEDHINAGTGKVRIEGTGNYDGVYEQGFLISPQMISDSGVTLSADHFVYSGQAITPKVTVKNSAGNSLVKDTDYQITYATGRTNAGTYSITVSGIGNYSGEIVKKFTVSPQKISPSSVILYTSTFTYNKRTVTPEIFVRNADRKGLVQNRDYQVSYTGNRKNVGTHGITVSGKGNYSGSVTKSFRINPPKTKLSKLNAGKRSVTVKWKKQTQQVSGYQIRYSKKSSMKGAKTVWVKSSKKVSRKITRLNSRKRYYFQIRTYKSVNGTKYYSGWSSKKKVTVK